MKNKQTSYYLISAAVENEVEAYTTMIKLKKKINTICRSLRHAFQLVTAYRLWNTGLEDGQKVTSMYWKLGLARSTVRIIWTWKEKVWYKSMVIKILREYEPQIMVSWVKK